MKKALLTAALVLAAATGAKATPLTGDLAIAGLDTFNSTGINFQNPGAILLATGSFKPMNTVPQVNMTSGTFASLVGKDLFDWDHNGIDIVGKLVALSVEKNGPNFLNVKGTLDVTENGASDTEFAFTLTSTRPDGSTSYTADIVTLSAIPEPGTLLLLGSGLLGVALLYGRKVRQ